MRLVPVLVGDRISTAVLEPDGARTGFAMRPAPEDGFTIEGIEGVAAFISRRAVQDAEVAMRMLKRNDGRRRR